MTKWNPETAQETRINPVTGKEEKKCSKCGCVKPVEFFGPSKIHPCGFKSICKRCTNNKYTKGMKKKYGNASMKGLVGNNKNNKS